MNFSQLQLLLSQKLGTTETINFDNVSRKQAINDALLHNIQEFTKWRQLIVTRPLTFLYIGRLFCGVTSKQSVADWSSIVDGSFRISIDGTGYNIDAIDFTGNTTLDEVASTIQTSIRSATGGVETVTYNNNNFVIVSGTTGSGSVVSVLSLSTGTVGTDISDISYMNGSNIHATATTYATSSIPNDYREMIKLFKTDSDGYESYLYGYKIDFEQRTARTWTKLDLLGTKTFFVYSEDDITLTAKYRAKLFTMTDSTDETGLDNLFDEPIVLFAATRLMIQKRPDDIRIQDYRNTATSILQELYTRDYEASERHTRKIRTSKGLRRLYN